MVIKKAPIMALFLILNVIEINRLLTVCLLFL